MNEEKTNDLKSPPGESLDAGTVRLMKEAGLERPKDVTVRSWSQPQDLQSPKYQTIAYLAARGMKPSEIADAIGMATDSITALLASERMQFEVKRITNKLFGRDITKRFKEILPAAVDAAEEVMNDRLAKPAVRLAAATNFMDRALGRPKQSIEVEGSGFKELLEVLDAKRKSGDTSPTIIDVEEVKVVEEVEENPNQRVKPDRSENPNLNRPFDPDEWVKKTL